MADSFRLAVAVLAAGQSERFGKEDKLRVPFRGKPLGLYATDALGRVAAETRIVVTSDPAHICARGWKAAGFAAVKNPDARQGMGTSVAVAARIARRSGADALLIALADMPLVPRGHYRALAAEARKGGAQAVVASLGQQVAMPPAVIGRGHFDHLASLEGDTGARSLLREARIIACPPEWLTDIDTPEALAAFD